MSSSFIGRIELLVSTTGSRQTVETARLIGRLGTIAKSAFPSARSWSIDVRVLGNRSSRQGIESSESFCSARMALGESSQISSTVLPV